MSTQKSGKIQELLYSRNNFFGGSDDKEYAYNAGDPGLIPGSGRSPGEGHGNPLQYFCLENSTDRGAQWATVHGCKEQDMTGQLMLSRGSETQWK